MQRLFLIRHAESVWNRDGVVQGFRDCELSDLGREQAHRLAQRLAAEQFDAVYSSTATRAVETARIALGDKVSVVPVGDIREINLGVWEGRRAADLKRELPEATDLWFRAPSKVHIEGAERLGAFRRRVVRAIDSIVERHPNETVAVFTHGGVICIYLTGMLGLRLDDMWRFMAHNGSVTKLIYPAGRPRIEMLNDVSHLDGVLRDPPGVRLSNPQR